MRAARSIVLVDDDRDDQEIFKSACAIIDKTVEVVGFESGETALKTLSSMSSQPDVIFLDLNMPRLDGIAVLEELKHSSQLKSIPVIIYSTSFDTSVKTRCSNLGAIDVIEKPNCFESLCSKLRAVLFIQ
jgi:CheY-like chemotaxis protein